MSLGWVSFHVGPIPRIGFSIAKKLVGDGANVMVSSRREEKVRKAVESLKGIEGGKVEGMVCHVGKADHRTNLIKEVRKLWRGRGERDKGRGKESSMFCTSVLDNCKVWQAGHSGLQCCS